MSLSVCDYCGGHISLGPCSLSRCESCGLGVIERDPLPPVGGIDDSEIVSLRAEVARLRKENEALKKIERQRWENVNKTFGTSYSTARDYMGLPMNVSDFGTRRPGDF